MPRRALIPGDIVAASPHRRGRQAHLADRLDPKAAIRDGVLLPHRQYVVVEQLVAGQKIEMFARRRRPGWCARGNEL